MLTMIKAYRENGQPALILVSALCDLCGAIKYVGERDYTPTEQLFNLPAGWWSEPYAYEQPRARHVCGDCYEAGVNVQGANDR